MAALIKTIFYISTLLAITNAFAIDSQSLVVSSTEPTKEETTETSTPKENPTPQIPKIYDMKICTNISNRFAKTSVVSKVKNLAKTPQETTFSVVLPETAYISEFVMEIDGKSYKAYVKEKEEAKQIYNEAIDRGQAAAHVEANARDSNRFTVSINVEPQKKAIFTLKYEELLQREKGQYEVVINIHPGQPVKDLNVEVNINETKPLKFVKSPALRSGNEINKNDDQKLASLADIKMIDSKSATVKFNPNIERQKQLASGLGTEEERGLAGQFVVQYDVDRDAEGGDVLLKDGYFVHFFAPNDVTPLPKHVIFVLDTSGSMEGTRIKQLKEAMNSILSELKKEDLLSIVEFGSSVKVWNVDKVAVDYEVGDEPYWQPYGLGTEPPKKNKTEQVLPPPFAANDENVNKAKNVVEKLNAFGGTDIKSALDVGLQIAKGHKNKEDTHQPMIVFLTDGEPTVGETNPEKITSAISEINTGKAPIFSLSFGDGADRKFLQKISLQNQGFARHIYEAADASLQLQEFYKQISSPLLKNVSFKYVSNVTEVTRTVFPIFFRGSEFVVAGVVPDQGFAPPEIHGDSIQGPIQWIPKVETPIGDLERLWAYLTLKQVLEQRDAAENKTQFTKKALDIALKYSFVTPVSSLVVVKPNATKAVDTEDASKSAADSHYGHRIAGGFGYPQFAAAPSLGSAGFGGGAPLYAFQAPAPASSFSAVQKLAMPYAPADRIFSHVMDSDAVESEALTTPVELSTATLLQTAVTEHIEQPYQSLKAELPWLNDDILAENGTITVASGDFELETNGTVTSYPACPKVPINGTAGVCTPLIECTQVYSLLTSLAIYNEYFCPLDNIAGVCCPKPTPQQTP